MSRVLKLSVLCCCIVGLMSASAMAQVPRMFVVPLNADPTLYPSGTTTIFASQSDQVCVGVYVTGTIVSKGVQIAIDSLDTTPAGPVASGTVDADCSTVTIDNARGDYIGFGTPTASTVACDVAPFAARYVLFTIGGNVDLSGFPNGAYAAELCYDVSADACGTFNFGYQSIGLETQIADVNGTALLPPNAIYDTLDIVVAPPNDVCADAIALADGVPSAYDTTCGSADGPATCSADADVFFTYVATCDAAEITVAVTGGATWATYDDGCTLASPVGVCDDTSITPADLGLGGVIPSGTALTFQLSGVDVSGDITATCVSACTANAPAGSALTNTECDPTGTINTDPCLMWFCQLGAGCVLVSTDPNDAGNTTDGTACDDGEFCTVDDNCGGGTCSNSNPNLSCIDENPCSVDFCCENVGDVIWSSTAGDVTCAVADVCENVDINTIACNDLNDCPAGSTACNAGFCVCVANPPLCIEVQDQSGTANCLTVAEGGIVTVNVVKGPGTTGICAAQLFMEYDPTCLDFLDIVPGGGVFNTPIYTFIDEAAGTIDYVVGENPGAICNSVKEEAIVAVITFQSTANCKCDAPCFRGHNPPTVLGAEDGESVCPLGHIRPDGSCGLLNNPDADPCCDGAFSIDTTPPVVDCPDVDFKAFGNADCGEVTRTVTWDPPTAADNCDGALPVNCTISHNGGAPVQHLLMGGGAFPPGVTTIDCGTTIDNCGNSSGCIFSVGNSGLNGIHVDVELSPTMHGGPLDRCIEFWVSDCGPIANPADPLIVSDTVEFGFPFNIPGHGEAQAKVPPGNWTCLTARDPHHTLNATCDLTCADIPGKGNVWYASFKGSKDLSDSCHWLVNGNLNGLDDDGVGRIDVLDYVTYLACVATNPAPGADTACGDALPHCDINGDGIVSLLDFSFILVNIFQTDKLGCEAVCSPTVAAGEIGGARESITVEELVGMGYGSEARAADADGNGVVNLTDMALYLQKGEVSSRDVNKGRSVRGLR